MKFYWRAAGWCKAIERLTISGGRWKVREYPAKFGLFRHPTQGWTLFDTGYAPRFLEATTSFPYKLYRWATPVRIPPEVSAVAQVSALGLRPEEVKTVILSHLHGDHMAGLKDFPQATIVTSRFGYEALAGLSGTAAVRRGFLPQFLPSDFEKRAHWIDGDTDLWGDGKVRLLPLPGHAPGQHGALLRTEHGEVFLCADAVWHSCSYRENRDLPWLTHAILTQDRAAFQQSLRFLRAFHKEHPEVKILPSHCHEVEL